MGFQECILLFKEYGGFQYLIGENITQLQHALQAAHIAKICKAPNYIIIGMLLHDIGQLIGRDINHDITIDDLHASHDDLGAMWLYDEGFKSDICDIAKYHTLAKVLLCDKSPDYLSQLSLASQQSYFIQKQKYQNLPTVKNVETLLACRLIDDMAKIPHFNPGSLDDYELLYNQVLTDDIINDIKWIDNVKALFELQNHDHFKFLEKVVYHIN